MASERTENRKSNDGKIIPGARKKKGQKEVQRTLENDAVAKPGARVAAEYIRDAESRVQRAQEICKGGTERKREDNQRSRAGYDLSHAVNSAHGGSDVADHYDGVRAAYRGPERAASPVVDRLNVIEQRRAHDREVPHQKMLEPERAQGQRSH